MKKFGERELEEIINQQFKINNIKYSYKQAIDNKNWLNLYETTKEKEEEWRVYLKKYIKPYVLKIRLDKEVSHIITNFGLRVNNYNVAT